jgi:HEAT repeat protein
LERGDIFERRSVVAAIGHWGEDEHLALLVERLNDSDFVVRRAVMDILAERKFVPACQPLAKLLAGGLDRPKASEGLQKYGATAESAVREQLTHSDLWVRIEACRILKTIGTSDSIAALESAARDDNPLQKRAAQEALQAIRAAIRPAD